MSILKFYPVVLKNPFFKLEALYFLKKPPTRRQNPKMAEGKEGKEKIVGQVITTYKVVIRGQ